MDGSQLSWNQEQKTETVWVQDHVDAWMEGTIVEVESECVKVKCDGEGTVLDIELDKNQHAINKKLLPRDIGPKSDGLRNMDDLTHLHEASILHNVCVRFKKKLIYTRTGPILVAMNPFEWLPIYEQDIMKTYRQAGARIDDLEPHCFAEAERAFQRMTKQHSSQSLIICGESGAGKTETTKLMLQYLSQNYTDEAVKGISEKIMKSNPVMEAFGNAKTLRNKNSSRFGKFIRLDFGGSRVLGAHISNYLLEKSRTVRQNAGERNYHIFYQICKGANSKQQNELGVNSANLRKFSYLNQSNCFELVGTDDAADFISTIQAMESVGMEREEVDAILRIVAAILHLGNISFGKVNRSGNKGTETEESKDSEEENFNLDPLSMACELLGCETKRLSHALQIKFISVGGKHIESPLDDAKASDLRDALSKTLYEKLFDTIVSRINDSLSSNVFSEEKNHTFIGILDIYGFESFQVNGFEQLLINFANEKLQSLFNEQVFQAEECMYRAEDVPFSRTDIPNNDKCLTLMDGIFKLMHDECLRMDAGSELGLVKHIAQKYKSEEDFGVCGPGSKRRNTTELDFAIQHYAGEIIYTTTQFLEKNRDTLHWHVQEVLSDSKTSLVRSLFAPDHDQTVARLQPEPKKKGKLQETVAKRFSQQVSELTHAISNTGPIFVRCIKTNNDLVPNKVDRQSILRQLKNAGVVAALEMRRAGFPNRLLYRDFVLRCRALLPRSAKLDQPDWQELTKALFTGGKLNVSSDSIAMGRTKLFLRANALHIIDGTIQKHLNEFVVVLQGVVRQFLCWKRYRSKKVCAVFVQSRFRGARDRKIFAKYIESLEEKKKWILRQATFDRQRKAVLALQISKQALLSTVSNSNHRDLLQIEKVEKIYDRVEVLEKELELVLELKNGEMDKVDNLIATYISAVKDFDASISNSNQQTQAVSREVSELRRQITSVMDEMEGLEEDQERYRYVFYDQTLKTRAFQLFIGNPLVKPSEDEGELDEVVERYSPRFSEVKDSVVEFLEKTEVLLVNYQITEARHCADLAASTAERAREMLENALIKKKDIDNQVSLLKVALQKFQRQYVQGVGRALRSSEILSIREVQAAMNHTRENLQILLKAVLRNSSKSNIDRHIQELQDMAHENMVLSAKRESSTRTRPQLSDTMSEASSDSITSEDEDTKSIFDDDECSSSGEEEFAFESILVGDIESANSALGRANSALQQLDEVVGRAREFFDDRVQAIEHVCNAKRTATELLDSVRKDQEERFSEAHCAVLFNAEPVSRAKRNAKLWIERAELASKRTLVSLSDEGDSSPLITTEIEKCATETIFRAEKFVSRILQAGKLLEEVVQAQEKLRQQMVPAVGLLSRLYEEVTENHLTRRPDVQEALACVQREFDDARKLLILSRDDPFPRKSFLVHLEKSVQTALSVLQTAREYVAEEIQHQKQADSHIQVARKELASASTDLGILEARIEEHWVFETRKLNSLCKASSCGATVCDTANQLVSFLHTIRHSISRSSRKLAEIGALSMKQRTKDTEFSFERNKLVSDLNRSVAKSKDLLVRSSQVLEDLIIARSKELEVISEHVRRREEIKLKLNRSKDLVNTLRIFDAHGSENIFKSQTQRALDDAVCHFKRYDEAVSILYSEDDTEYGSDNAFETDFSRNTTEQDSIKVLMFVKREPFRVLETSHAAVSSSLEGLERLIDVETGFVSKRQELMALESKKRQEMEFNLQSQRLAREQKLILLRKRSSEDFKSARQTVAAIAKIFKFCELRDDAHMFSEKTTAVMSQVVRVQHALVMIEKSLGDHDADLAERYIGLAHGEDEVLRSLLFGASTSEGVHSGEEKSVFNYKALGTNTLAEMEAQCPAVVWEVERLFDQGGGTLSEAVRVLDLEKSKLRVLAAELELYQLESQSNKMRAKDWCLDQLLEEASAAIQVANETVSILSKYPSPTFVLLQCLGLESESSLKTTELKQRIDTLSTRINHAKLSVQKLSVSLDRCRREKQKCTQMEAKAKRLVLRYVCAAQDK